MPKQDYTERLRTYFVTLRLDDTEFARYCNEVASLINERDSSKRIHRKPSDIEQSIMRFVTGQVKAPDGDRLNVYLLAIDKVEAQAQAAGDFSKQTAIDVLAGLGPKDLWWKQLTRIMTSDYKMDPSMQKHFLRRDVQVELKSLFARVMWFCRERDPVEFAERLRELTDYIPQVGKMLGFESEIDT